MACALAHRDTDQVRGTYHRGAHWDERVAMFSGQPADYAAPGFPGQSRTSGLGGADLYYNRYRDHDPTAGRYIQADPIGFAGGPSLYSYAMNNPLRFSDPTGDHTLLVVLLGSVIIDAVIERSYERARRMPSRQNVAKRHSAA